jgi:hypothetical protein
MGGRVGVRARAAPTSVDQTSKLPIGGSRQQTIFTEIARNSSLRKQRCLMMRADQG